MLKEICITPHVFDREHIDSSNWKEINRLLEVLSNSGFILGINNKDWTRAVFDKISHLEPKVKDKLSAALSMLKDRDRIAGHPKDDVFSGTGEDAWFDIAKGLNDIRDFYRIIATQPYDGKAITTAQLEDMNIYQEFGLTGSTQVLKTAKNLHHLLLPFLSYAKKVTIIDPYFHLDRPKYLETLNIVAKCFRERRGQKERGRMLIHCRWDEDKSGYVEKWQKAIDKMSSVYGHSLELYAWEGIDYAIKLHDRYIITNQCGLVSAAGTDTDDRQQSEWSIKDYGELNKVLSQYNENSSPFKLKCKVTISSVEFS